MKIRAAINGYGRIGRTLIRALLDRPEVPIDIVAIHDSGQSEAITHLTAYDSTYGPLKHPVRQSSDHVLEVGPHTIQLLHGYTPDTWPWEALNIDLVFECTGRITKAGHAHRHLSRGASKVLISAPSAEAEATIVYGLNEQDILPSHRLLSTASCTTNCLAHIVAPLRETVGIQSGFLNTVHAYTNDQRLLDSHHTDLRRARAAGLSIIPTKTGATETLALIFPELANSIDGLSVRVPTPHVSMIDFTFVPRTACTREELITHFTQAAQQHPELQLSTAPLVSIDFLQNPASAIIDLPLLQVLPSLIKVCAWYDNEWGFTQRLIDTAHYMYQ